ncbi:MAG TPA: hypothetical protein VGL78_02820, partial [Solirubrobacteraceae bacterium]
HPARPIHPAQQKGSATTGGRERTADQWQQLLGQAGWLPTRMGQGMIGTPVDLGVTRGFGPVGLLI